MKILLHFNSFSIKYQRKISKFLGSNPAQYIPDPAQGVKFFLYFFGLLVKSSFFVVLKA